MAPTFDRPLICPVLVGRDACIEALDRSLDEVQAGRGHTLLISGEAGIGKSRLIAAMHTRAAGAARVIQGICFERDQSLPYAPFVDALRTQSRGLDPVLALQRLGSDLASLMPEFGVMVSADDGPEQTQRRAIESLVRFLRDMAVQRPLVLVVEDLHWSDEASLQVFGVLARRLHDEPVLLVGTYRDDEGRPALAALLAELDRARFSSELHLSRLSPAHVEAMLRAIFDSSRVVRQSLVQRLFDLTDGNPFFVEEVLRSLFAVAPPRRSIWTTC